MSTVFPEKEIRWVFLWSILIVGLTCLPYLYAYLVAPDDMQFTGLLSNPMDGNSYLAKMRQGAQGKWLFHLTYTSEDHEEAFIFTYYLFPASIEGRLRQWEHSGDYDYVVVDSTTLNSVRRWSTAISLKRLETEYGIYAQGDGVYLYKRGYTGEARAIP